MSYSTGDCVNALADDLGDLADHMYEAVQAMRDVRHVGGPDELADHADELAGVAEIVTDWAQGLREEK